MDRDCREHRQEGDRRVPGAVAERATRRRGAGAHRRAGTRGVQRRRAWPSRSSARPCCGQTSNRGHTGRLRSQAPSSGLITWLMSRKKWVSVRIPVGDVYLLNAGTGVFAAGFSSFARGKANRDIQDSKIDFSFYRPIYFEFYRRSFFWGLLKPGFVRALPCGQVSVCGGGLPD